MSDAAQKNNPIGNAFKAVKNFYDGKENNAAKTFAYGVLGLGFLDEINQHRFPKAEPKTLSKAAIGWIGLSWVSGEAVHTASEIGDGLINRDEKSLGMGTVRLASQVAIGGLSLVVPGMIPREAPMAGKLFAAAVAGDILGSLGLNIFQGVLNKHTHAFTDPIGHALLSIGQPTHHDVAQPVNAQATPAQAVSTKALSIS